MEYLGVDNLLRDENFWAAKFNRTRPLGPPPGSPGGRNIEKNENLSKNQFNPMSSHLNCILNPILVSKPTPNQPKSRT